MSRFVKELSKHESHWLCQEYATRKKWDTKPVMLYPKKTTKERFDLFQNTPVLYRKEEKYIDPHEGGWEERYYEMLFSNETRSQEPEFRKTVGVNYLEGLEWVTQYYLEGKVDWMWKYRYHYPPLLKDLAPLVPQYSTNFLCEENTKPVDPNIQLAYVLPPIYHHLLPKQVNKSEISTYYKGLPLHNNGLPELEFQWAFRRFFWECHVHLPEISIQKLQEVYRSSD